MSIGPGTKLGQYEVQEFIGQGAMGFVYRAYHVQLERTGAVKVMQALAPDPEATARFRHEAQAIAQMRHPNILNVYDFGEFEGTPYMIVEFVSGGNLAHRLAKGPIDRATALRYLRGIAAGLDYAHQHGVVHRDVKPANVLLGQDDTPVLADFGLAKLLQGSSLKSMTGVTTGTPAYMAPEQVAGRNVGPAADRYSLATIAYEMLTGVIPFDGEGLIELLYAQVHREPTPPTSRNGELNPRVDAVIMRGLAKDPAARWETCTAMVDALADALAGRRQAAVAKTVVMAPAVVAAAPPIARHGAPAAPPASQPEATIAAQESNETIVVAYPSPPTSALKRKSRKGLVAVVTAIVLVVLLVLGLVGFLALRPPISLSLTPSTVAAGDSVLVTASHVPANQTGEVRLHSVIQTFPFRADSGGNVRLYIAIPQDEGIGDHLVQICWTSVCHMTVVLHVLEPAVVVASPTPAPSPSPSPSASASATPTAKPVVTLLAISASGTFTVRLQNFTVGRPASLVVIQRDKSNFAGSVNVQASDFTATVKTPSPIVPLVSAYVVACNNASSPCYSSAAMTVKA